MSGLILLTGATGYVGGRLLSLLQQQGLHVRCLTRRPEALRHRVTATTEVVRGDVSDPGSLGPAFEEVEAAYYFVHSMGDNRDFESQDRIAAENFARAATHAGVRRLIYLGGLGNPTGNVFLNGGTLSASSIYMSGGGLLDITAGTMLIAGDARALVGTYISNGWITASGGLATPFVSYGVLNPGRTTVLATAPAYGYALWALGWGLPIGTTTNDYDGDLLKNLGEYALNGNPTNALDTGVQPTLTRSGHDLRYAHLRRNDDTNLVYVVETRTNLVSGVWTNAGYTATGTNALGGAYDEVLYRIPVDAPQTYIRLKISYP